LRPRSSLTPVQWCHEHLCFDEAEYRGPFESRRAEYLIETLNDFADITIHDAVLCWGSQTKKTGTLMAGALWSVSNDPSGIFWVMATVPLARKFSKQRLLPMIRKTLPELIPTGARRFEVNSMDMQLGAAQINMAGSNSPAALSSTPSRRIILDEVDKFDEGGRGEADAVNLAEQRAKNVACPQRWKTSTPTLYTGLIWQEFLKGDQRRYFVPCPHCAHDVVLAWSAQFTVFKPTGAEAFVKWDGDSKRKDGTWDMDRVRRSARAECPFCGGEIRDGHKTRMVREGKWKATAPAAVSFRSRHLPSMYASSPECTFGSMAVRFLEAKRSLQGLQGFINGDLAEPYQSQDMLQARTELITDRVTADPSAPWLKFMTVDCQAREPFFWYVVRAWKGGESEALQAGSADTWEQLREIQLKHGVPDVCFGVDSGYGAKDDHEVYLNCARFSEFVAQPAGLAQAVGWLPTKGMPSRKRWESEDGTKKPWFLSSVDPFTDSANAGKARMSLLEFSAEHFKDVLHRLRAQRHGRWSVKSEVSNDEYWRHLDAWIRTEVRPKKGSAVIQWVLRDKHWPDHLADCEVLQVVLATFHQALSD
jgi:hypothetical protein